MTIDVEFSINTIPLQLIDLHIPLLSNTVYSGIYQ